MCRGSTGSYTEYSKGRSSFSDGAQSMSVLSRGLRLQVSGKQWISMLICEAFDGPRYF